MSEERNEQADLSKLANAFFQNLERDNCEYGGWGLDDKRPFGNSDVATDILEIIGWDPVADDYYSETQQEYAHSLYDKLADYLKDTWQRRATVPQESEQLIPEHEPGSPMGKAKAALAALGAKV